MDNPEEILHSLEEFSKLKPKDIPNELEEYLSFVAKTGDPVFQWGSVRALFREKMLHVVADFFESCPVEIPPCPNVEPFKYESLKEFILERLDSFAAAPFTVQRICELLTKPRKEYNRIDKYMRALEKNLLVVSTTEPGNRHATENGDDLVNGVELLNSLDSKNDNSHDDCKSDVHIMEEMDVPAQWPCCEATSMTMSIDTDEPQSSNDSHTQQLEFATSRSKSPPQLMEAALCQSPPDREEPYVSIGPVSSETCIRDSAPEESDVTVTITTITSTNRRSSIEAPCAVVVQDSAVETSVEYQTTEEDVEEDSPGKVGEEEEEEEREELEDGSKDNKEAFIVLFQNDEEGDKQKVLILDSSTQPDSLNKETKHSEVSESESDVTVTASLAQESPEIDIDNSIAFKEDEEEEADSCSEAIPTSSTTTEAAVEIVELNLPCVAGEKDSLISSSDEVSNEPAKENDSASKADSEEAEAQESSTSALFLEEEILTSNADADAEATPQESTTINDQPQEVTTSLEKQEYTVELEEPCSSSPDCPTTSETTALRCLESHLTPDI